MKRHGMFLLLAGLCLMPSGVLAQQQSNEGATVTAPFMVVPPTIDGKVSAGEWDGAGVAGGQWTMHDSADPASDVETTTVKLAYGLKGLYILYECVDAEPVALAGGSEVRGANTFSFGGDTDYLAVYIDPANYTGPNADVYSYSIQVEPSFSANEEGDDLGNSYTFTESGRWGGFRTPYQPPRVMDDGSVVYFGGGGEWDLETSKVMDGPTADGFVSEWFVTWTDLIGYWRHNMGNLLDVGAPVYEVELNGDVAVAETSQYGTIRAYETPEGEDPAPVGHGMTGLPPEGTQWQIQICRYNGTNGEYTNWVGDTGGFVSRPFGTLIFGPAPATAVRDAMLYSQ